MRIAENHARHVDGPAPKLSVPTDVARMLDAALATGHADAAQFHGSSVKDLTHFAVTQLGPPPSGDAQRAELAVLHGVAGARTSDDIAAAQWYAAHGVEDMWRPIVDEYTRRVGHDQAKSGVAMLQRAMQATESVTASLKSTYHRDRPFVVDPTLKVVVHRPENESYPSGHSSLAFAAAMTLGKLMPDRADDLLNAARSVAYSRLVGSVHFPSDVAAGARLAAMVTDVVLGTHMKVATHAGHSRP